jgi:hypothetical protein
VWMYAPGSHEVSWWVDVIGWITDSEESWQQLNRFGPPADLRCPVKDGRRKPRCGC